MTSHTKWDAETHMEANGQSKVLEFRLRLIDGVPRSEYEAIKDRSLITGWTYGDYVEALQDFEVVSWQNGLLTTVKKRRAVNHDGA